MVIAGKMCRCIQVPHHRYAQTQPKVQHRIFVLVSTNVSVCYFLNKLLSDLFCRRRLEHKYNEI